jgi:Tol biopolymer transport system component
MLLAVGPALVRIKVHAADRPRLAHLNPERGPGRLSSSTLSIEREVMPGSFIGSATRSVAVVSSLILAGAAPLVAQDAAKPLPGIYIMNPDGANFRLAVKLPGKWNGTPSISPDGKTLLFDASEAGQFQLGHVYVMPTDGTAENVKELGVGSAPCWSADGRQIVFYVHQGNPDSAEPGIWVMNADGNGRRWMSTGRGPRWSPDGKRLLVLDNLEQTGDGLYVMDLQKRDELEVVLDHTYPMIAGASWAPDGKRLAYLRHSGRKSELVIQPLEGKDRGERVRLAKGANDARDPRTNRSMGWRPTWSPDGKYLLLWIAGAAGPEQLHRIEADTTSEPELLAHQDVGRVNTDPHWSADGKWIVFASDR